MSNLETTYLGLQLKNPLVAASSGLTSSVEKIIELELDDATKEKFAKSVESIQDGINILKENNFFS